MWEKHFKYHFFFTSTLGVLKEDKILEVKFTMWYPNFRYKPLETNKTKTNYTKSKQTN